MIITSSLEKIENYYFVIQFTPVEVSEMCSSLRRSNITIVSTKNYIRFFTETPQFSNVFIVANFV